MQHPFEIDSTAWVAAWKPGWARFSGPQEKTACRRRMRNAFQHGFQAYVMGAQAINCRGATQIKPRTVRGTRADTHRSITSVHISEDTTRLEIENRLTAARMLFSCPFVHFVVVDCDRDCDRDYDRNEAASRIRPAVPRNEGANASPASISSHQNSEIAFNNDFAAFPRIAYWRLQSKTGPRSPAWVSSRLDGFVGSGQSLMFVLALESRSLSR